MKVNGKFFNYKYQGFGKENIVFVYGFGGILYYWSLLILIFFLDMIYLLYFFDLEGNGLSLMYFFSDLIVELFVVDFCGIFDLGNMFEFNFVVFVVYFMGCLVVMWFVFDNLQFVKKLVLVGLLFFLFFSVVFEGIFVRVVFVWVKGMNVVVQIVVNVGILECLKKYNFFVIVVIILSFFGQDLEVYVKVCWVLVWVQQVLDLEFVKMKILIIIGDEDKVFLFKLCEGYVGRIG